ncbi:MAG: branched-chain amino acid transport system substrate-binding protein [Micromonosporaceae bacterium]|nr:branched-chain amino acid transport system substrate-binding protein [Micromonosporaceae bacterium]
MSDPLALGRKQTVSQLYNWNHAVVPGSRGEDEASLIDRRQLLRMIGAIAALGATGGAAACSSALPTTQLEVPNGRTISIGLVTPALGAFAKIGDDIQKGFKLFLDDHNNLLGLNRVDLKTAEEGPTPDSAAAAVKGLLDQGVIAIAGVASPAALAPVSQTMLDARIPLLACCSAAKSVTSPYLWRTASVEGEAGQALASFARGEGGNAWLFYDDASNAEASSFKKWYQQVGGKIIGETAGKQSLVSRLQAARADGADIIFASYNGADALALVQAYRDSGLGIKLIGPGGLTESADLGTVQWPAITSTNIYTDMYYAADLANQDNRQFVSSYFRTHGVQPSCYAMAAYDTALVLDKALRLVRGTPTGPDLNNAFSSVGQIESPRGAWMFNKDRGPQQRWYLRRLRSDGQVLGNLLDADLQVLSPDPPTS